MNVEELLAVWKLVHGYSWIPFHVAVDFKLKLGVDDEIQITQLARDGLLERNRLSDDFLQYYVRLRKPDHE